ncbi:nuclear transport factor 2 family protein [uncultured Sphingomonas sp.]|uniref:nuclear transport factor 2 family protein n=1 Tax=uncultured Sphingomonas sp. TaxID=158754 RepID=UPI0035CA3A13
MSRLTGLLGIALAGALFSTPALSAPASVDAALARLVDGFVDAQRRYDPRALSELTTLDYIEVSPVGDVDTREEMLSFYAPEKKRPAPQITVSERMVRSQGTEAIMLAKLSMAVPVPGGGTRSIDMRATYVARRVGGDWRLASAQFTPIRSSAS